MIPLWVLFWYLGDLGGLSHKHGALGGTESVFSGYVVEIKRTYYEPVTKKMDL